MAQIDINIKNLASANARLPRLVNRTGTINHKVALMKWRIPEEIQTELELKEPLKDITKGLTEIENSLDELHNAVDSVITTVMNNESSLTSSADEFL